jgi:hypothetical protein
MDEKEGPYRLVRNIADSTSGFRYSIAVQEKDNRPFFQTVIPDAGTGETARLICILLNKHHKEKTDEEADTATGDHEGVERQDLDDGRA